MLEGEGGVDVEAIFSPRPGGRSAGEDNDELMERAVHGGGADEAAVARHRPPAWRRPRGAGAVV